VQFEGTMDLCVAQLSPLEW